MSCANFKHELILCRDLCCSLQAKRMLMNQQEFCFTIPSEIFSWIEDEINVPVYRSGFQDLAFVLAKDAKTQLSVINFFEKANSVFIPRFFHNEQQAMNWITANRSEMVFVELNKPPEAFEVCIDIRLTPNKSMVNLQLEFPIDSLPHSLNALKQHMDKMSFMRKNSLKFSYLTKREIVILKLLVKGFQNLEIADKLF